MPHEHVENAGTRKRLTLWTELPPIDSLENEIGALWAFGMLQSDLSEREGDALQPPVDGQRAPLAVSAGSYPLRVHTKLRRLQLQ